MVSSKCRICPNIQCNQQWSRAASRQGKSVPTSGCFARLPRTRAAVLAMVDDRYCLAQRHGDSSHMMTSSNGNIFRVTGNLCGEFTGPRWIPRTKASDAKLWCLLWSASEKNGWVNNREAGDLRRYRTHYDVIVMNCCLQRIQTTAIST